MYMYVKLNHSATQQKLTQHCKSTIYLTFGATLGQDPDSSSMNIRKSIFCRTKAPTQTEDGNFRLVSGLQPYPSTINQSEESHIPCNSQSRFCL